MGPRKRVLLTIAVLSAAAVAPASAEPQPPFFSGPTEIDRTDPVKLVESVLKHHERTNEIRIRESYPRTIRNQRNLLAILRKHTARGPFLTKLDEFEKDLDLLDKMLADLREYAYDRSIVCREVELDPMACDDHFTALVSAYAQRESARLAKAGLWSDPAAPGGLEKNMRLIEVRVDRDLKAILGKLGFRVKTKRGNRMHELTGDYHTAFQELTLEGRKSYHGPFVSVKHPRKDFLERIFRTVELRARFPDVSGGKVVTKDVEVRWTLLKVGKEWFLRPDRTMGFGTLHGAGGEGEFHVNSFFTDGVPDLDLDTPEDTARSFAHLYPALFDRGYYDFPRCGSRVQYGAHWARFCRSFEFRRWEEAAFEEALADEGFFDRLNEVVLETRSRKVGEASASFAFAVSYLDPNLGMYGMRKLRPAYTLRLDLVATGGLWKVISLVRN